MNAAATVEAYYEALRTGDPLESYFAAGESVVKFGVGDAHLGGDAVATALEKQTETTDEWIVESDQLQVTEQGDVAWFSDLVTLAWTDVTTGIRRRFETRWSGTMVATDEGWEFVTMHVSAPRES